MISSLHSKAASSRLFIVSLRPSRKFGGLGFRVLGFRVWGKAEGEVRRFLECGDLGLKLRRLGPVV